MSVSSRKLRKFAEEKHGLNKNDENISDVDDSPFPNVPRSNNVNLYNLLHEDDQSASEERGEENVEADEEAESSQTYRPKQEAKSTKKRIKKKKKSNPDKNQSEEDWGIDDFENEDALKIAQAQAKSKNRREPPLVMNGVLTIDRNHLNPKNELKRIFGSRAIQATETRNKKGRNRKPIKNLWLVTYRDLWGCMSKRGPELSMTVVEKKDGVTYFRFKHSANYRAAELKFLSCVESMDPEELMLLVQDYPFHVNTLIQLSEMSKMTEEFSVAANLIERALFALESGFHVNFNFKTPCRLDYRYQENRPLFIALFNHLQFVGQRACYRTALELCKVLLSLSPDEDPLAIILAMDFYAIRSGEYRWLIRFIEEGEASRNLSQLPNFAFAQALAHYFLEEIETADELLQDALIMFPGMLLPLLEKCNIQPDARTTASYFFANASLRQSTALQQLTQLYVLRNYHIWKDKSLLPFLERNVLAVLDRVNIDDPLIKDYAAKRAKRFESRTPRPVERHILLSDMKEVTITETGTTFNFDPFPPADSVNSYKRPERPRRDATYSTFFLFFRSLMPTFNIDDAEAELMRHPQDNVARQDDEGAVAVGHRTSLQQSMTSLLDAMRDLISTVRSQDEGNDGGDNASTDGEADT